MHAIVVGLLVQPLLAVGLILLVRRLHPTARLAPALVLCGITGAVLTALIVFMRSTVPIAPYEQRADPWMPLIEQSALSLYIGFGLGVIVSAVFAIPFALISNRGRNTPTS